MEKYTVQVLNDKEFDSLPYEGIKDSLGFADVKKGMAFVRNTGNKEFDLGTVAHEVNHLIEKHGKEHPDWDSGILHKKGGAARSFIPALLGALGPILAPFTGGLSLALAPLASGAANIGMDQYAKSNHPEQLGKPGNFGDILGAGALGAAEGYGVGQGVGGGIAGGTQAGAGFLSKAAGIGGGALVGTPATATASSTGGLLGTGGKLLGIGAPATGALPTGLSDTFSNAVGNSVGAGIGATMPSASLSPAASLVSGAIPLLGQSISTGANAPAMSLASGGVGNAAGQPLPLTGTVPPVSSPVSIDGLSNAVSKSVNPAGVQVPQLGAGNTLSSATGNAITPATNIGASSAPAAVAKTPFSFKDLVTPSNVIGGASLLGSMATPTPQFQMPDSVEELRSKIMAGNGLSPLGTQAQQSLQEILASTPSQINAPANDAYYADTNRRIDLQYEQAKKQLDSAYNNAGMLGSGEYFDQLRKLTQAQADAKDAFVQSENQRRFEYGSNQKYQAIQASLGVDKNTMDDLVGLTGLDVQTAAMMYGAKAADVTAIRQALGTLGAQAILQGQGIKTQPTVNVTLGK